MDGLALKLRVLRAQEGLTLIDAAEKLGVGRDTLSSIERGHQHPRFPTLKRIAEGYGVPVEDLLRAEA
jgi:transcriptional regulator with XRE-family HTH domain